MSKILINAAVEAIFATSSLARENAKKPRFSKKDYLKSARGKSNGTFAETIKKRS